MKSNFDRALSFVLAHEGGYVDHPKDPGGATNMGITRRKLAEHRGIKPYTALPKSEVRSLTKAEASKIYSNDFWKVMLCDSLPSGVDLSTMDYGVNSGPSQSVKDLQRCLKNTYSGNIDGIAGEKTITAARSENPATLIKAHCARRLGMYKSLAIWNTFGKGWSRRIAEVEATALSWVSTKEQMEKEVQDASQKSGGNIASAGGGAVVTGGSGTLTTLPWWVIIIVVILVSAPFVIRAVINAQRATAMKEAANAL